MSTVSRIVETRVKNLAALAGVTVNGAGAGDIRIKDKRTFTLVARQGTLGLGEAYMAGYWDCDDLETFFEKVFTANLGRSVKEGAGVVWTRILGRLTNIQTASNTRNLADTHYNVSNEMFEAMLGPTMAYSCAYWPEAADLDTAQLAKYDLVCRKLGLTENDRLLDIGCGWGGFARYAAATYGCHVTGLTISGEQARYARELCRGLPVTILCRDYRHMPDCLDGDTTFTKVSSIGMFEHVGHKNYRLFMRQVADRLVDDGLCLLHTIGCYRTLDFASSPWIEKYIFPSSMLPSLSHVSQASEGLLVLEDLQDIGYNYHRTLMCWHDRFEDYWHRRTHGQPLPKVWGSEDVFYRMWRFYLISTATSFRLRRTPVWQFVFSKHGVKGGYIAPR
ncbi:MAG: cyclopropane fatty acyl phospholipid synthase [Candidatus Puniceispirillaceae bacterium]